ncbi:hypothetical protein E1B28_012819 [Marasmius oreades]|uniref:Uncharacterized protein n=1 Tax=Marasmius oreades TaxID=181124 RepID=A0A9P7UPC5_9AGAR|nr:uncharacterized protein E1B28_012819 [Marasmius oreades]KAG7088865.1 hypothetical protein E1B28_012819 [Marasmius oreades]
MRIGGFYIPSDQVISFVYDKSDYPALRRIRKEFPSEPDPKALTEEQHGECLNAMKDYARKHHHLYALPISYPSMEGPIEEFSVIFVTRRTAFSRQAFHALDKKMDSERLEQFVPGEREQKVQKLIEDIYGP